MSRLKEKHDCSLAANSISMLPRLHPNASRFRKWVRELHKLILVSTINPKTVYVFRSQASICKERKRHIKHYKYTVHPYSAISMVREICMTIVWFIYFTVHAFQLSFRGSKSSPILIQYAQVISSICHLIHIALIFFTGYHDKKKRIVVLGLKPIAQHYLKTHIVFDVLLLIPTQAVFDYKELSWSAYFLHLAALPRIISMGEYFRQITLFLELGDMIHELFCLIIGGFILVHWWAVLLYGISKADLKLTAKDLSSWTSEGNILNGTMTSQYVQSLHKASALFFCTSVGMWNSDRPNEWLTYAIVIITGTLYINYITAFILQLSQSYKMSESTYDKLIYQLHQYTKAKKLPERLSVRLQLYYESKFREKFFREHRILSTLSEHLRYEIIYYTCNQFIQSTWFFENLPKAVVGHVIASLTSTILITNEVIYYEDELEAPKLYFIVSGSVCLYTSSGVELTHIEDGDYFGEHNILSKITDFEVSETTQNTRVVAAEITELLILNMKDFIKYVSDFPLAMNKIMQVAQVRDNFNVHALERRNQMMGIDLMSALRPDEFLETGRLRVLSGSRRYGLRTSQSQ